jgi:cephalosporin hydroxylase
VEGGRAKRSEARGEALPPPVSVSLSDTIRDYWLRRVEQHTHDSYAGVPLSKFPEDLRVYEHLIWESRANVVIEIGAQHGGSALWFRDRLAALAHYGSTGEVRVIAIDVDVAAARSNLASADPAFEREIILIEGDVLDSSLPDAVERQLPAGASCLVVEDSLHVYETTAAALRGFSRFVRQGGFFVVEDGCVDVEDMRLEPGWPRGVLPALRAWLRTPEGARFEVRRDLELYGVSCHPEGFIQRVR